MTIACPSCAGTGAVFAHQNTGPDKPHHWGNVPCITCRGYGRVPDDYPERKAKGHEMRAHRIALVLTLGEAAKRQGISVARLSRIEAGTDWTDAELSLMHDEKERRQ